MRCKTDFRNKNTKIKNAALLNDVKKKKLITDFIGP